MSTPPRARRPWALSLGRPFGVPVRVSPSFLLLGLLVADLDIAVVRQRLPLRPGGTVDTVAAVIALGLLASVAVHELAHAAVGRLLGMPVEQITLHLFGGLTSLGEEARRPAVQFLVTLAGPLVNVLGGGLAAAVWLASTPGTVPEVIGGQLALVNAGLAVYNLLPGLPLDGGQLLRAALWQLTGDPERALRGAGYGGLTVAAGTTVLGLHELTSPTGSSLAVFTLGVGLLVGLNAGQSLRSGSAARRFAGLVAGQLARPAFPVEPGLPLAEALRLAAEAGAGAVLLGERPGHPTAVLTEALVSRVPPARRPWVPASSASQRLTPATVLDARTGGSALVAALRSSPASDYLVVDGPHVVGVLRAADLTARLRR